jgi:hypothetical protein
MAFSFKTARFRRLHDAFRPLRGTKTAHRAPLSRVPNGFDLLISILIFAGAAVPSQATSIPFPKMTLAACFAIPDPVSRKSCLDNQGAAQDRSRQAMSALGDAPIKPPPDRALDTSFCRGDVECMRGSQELQTAGDCVDLATATNLGRGSEALAETIANNCLAEYLRKFYPETSLGEVQELEREAPNGILANIPGNHVGIGYAGKSGFLTLRAQANFDCRADHPGGDRTVCNAPFDKRFIEEDWPYWRDQWGKSRSEFDRIWAEKLQKEDYRRRWLQQLAAAPEQTSSAPAAPTPTAAGRSDALFIPEIDVDSVCAKAYGHIRAQGIGSEAKRCILQMQSSYDGVKSMWNDVTPEMKRECLRRDRLLSPGNPYRYQFIYECLDEQISDARRKELLNRDIHFHR